MRISLIREAVNEHVLLLDAHHLIADGWSITVLLRELGALYSAIVNHQVASLPGLDIQYTNYAQWQATWLESVEFGQQLAYWKGQLADVPALDLPTDRSRPAVASFNGALWPFELSPTMSQSLTALAQREGATLYMVLLAAFKLLLARWSGQRDIVVGSPTAGRKTRELRGLVGIFVNALVMRTQVSERETFSELLKRVRNVTLEAYAHQDLPYEKLLEQLHPRRDLSRPPLFQVMFSMHDFFREELQLANVRSKVLKVPRVASKFDLTLELANDGERIAGGFEYATDLFEPATVQRTAHYTKLLEEIVAQPNAQLMALSMVPSDEIRRRENHRRRSPDDLFPRSAIQGTLPDRFEQQAQLHPQRPAIAFGASVWTYEYLNDRANAIANWLIDTRSGKPEPILLDFSNQPLAIATILGVLKAGKHYVPLDRAHPAERLALIVRDSGAEVLLSGRTIESARQLIGADLAVTKNVAD